MMQAHGLRLSLPDGAGLVAPAEHRLEMTDEKRQHAPVLQDVRFKAVPPEGVVIDAQSIWRLQA
jgi:hypothetical protein